MIKFKLLIRKNIEETIKEKIRVTYNNIKLGESLLCIEDVIMADSDRKTLTKGRSYTVVICNINKFAVIDDEGDFHSFTYGKNRWLVKKTE